MKIRDLLAAESVSLHGEPGTKPEVIDEMVDLMCKRGNIADKEVYRQGVLAREQEGTTGVGMGIAIPHCKSSSVTEPGLAAMRIPKGTDYDALDGEPVDLLFLIAAPDTKDNIHLQVLSKLSTMLMDPEFTESLRESKTVDEFLEVIDLAEEQKDEAEATKAEETVEVGKPYILAVTACPTGIAHTYMAAESLEKKAEEMGVQIKVETRGSGGAKNVMTPQEIAGATAIIVAADTKVPTDRFDGCRVIECRVADGINKPEELISRAIAGDAPIFHAQEGSGGEESEEEGGGIVHRIYTDLMNGVSNMLPFVIGGGIMIALAFLIDTICGYGTTGGANFGTCTPLSAFFKYCGDLAMSLMVPVLAGFIAYSIADRPGLAVGFTGGLLASSGNALAASYIWDGEATGLQGLLATFGFTTAAGGNTVSGFLGGIAAGFLAGYIVLFLRRICDKLPASLEGIKPTFIYPLVGIFIESVLMCFIFNPLIGMINTALSTMLNALNGMGLITLLGLILGAMMAIDMGGPINKAAYVFGTGMLATAASLMEQGIPNTDPSVQVCYIVMASIMVGGMVPPVGIGLACRIFPKKFTESERSSWLSNLIMGASFVTEGAIPFAASDPIHVIPCTMVGAGVAGFLSAFFRCTLMAPHGGVFVFATVGRPFFYILAWVIGSVITCIMLGFLKKDVN